jgi:hypothetical protein
MVRPGTPAEKFIGHARHDDLIGISNHKKRKTCVIYKDQPYFDPRAQQSPRGPVFICNGQLLGSQSLNQYVVLISRNLSKDFQKISTPLIESSSGEDVNLKKLVNFYESSLDEITVKALRNSPGNSTQKISEHEYAQLLQGLWAYNNSYRVLKKEIDELFGETDYTDNTKSYTFVVDIYRDSTVTVVSRKRTNENDLGATDIVVNGQPREIVGADVSNSNKTITNIKNGVSALLSQADKIEVIRLERRV